MRCVDVLSRLAALGLALPLGACSLFGTAGHATAAQAPARTVQAAPLDEAVRDRYAQALAAMQRGDLQRAETFLQQLIASHPDLPGPRVNLALVYRQLRRTDEARTLLDESAARWPAFAPAQHQLGLLLRDDGRFEEADAAFAKAQAASPDYALAWYDRAVLNELYLQRLPVALENYVQFQTLQPAEDEQVARWINDLRRRTGTRPAAARPDTTDKPS